MKLSGLWLSLCAALILMCGCADEPSSAPALAEEPTLRDASPHDIGDTPSREDARSVSDAMVPDEGRDLSGAPPSEGGELGVAGVMGGEGGEQGGEQGGAAAAPQEGVRVIRLYTSEGPSWVAWREVEVVARYTGETGAPRDLAAEATLSASSSSEGEGPERAVDGDLSTAWNAGDFPPAWLELSFSTPIELSLLRLHVAQSPEGETAHEVLIGPSVEALRLARRFTGATNGSSTLEYTHSAQAPSGQPGELIFNILLRQTQQSCASCGIFFDWEGRQEHKPRLVVRYEREGAEHTVDYQHGLRGMDNAHSIWIQSSGAPEESARHQMLVKQAPHRNALFRAELSDIPEDATILEARLHLHLHSHEGLANSDRTSVLTVYECTQDWDWGSVSWTEASAGQAWERAGGDFGREVRELHAGRDMHDRGFNKGRPSGYFDFTPYMQLLQSERGR